MLFLSKTRLEGLGTPISIIVCVYNGSSYIDSCLSSLLNQVYPHYEIIIIDDGSTDDSLKRLTSYQKKI